MCGKILEDNLSNTLKLGRSSDIEQDNDPKHKAAATVKQPRGKCCTIARSKSRS